MTLIKSLLLGSAAGIVAIASAQAADLPTKKGAPAVEYVKVCKITVAGKPVVGFTLPGSDTCMHLTGYITGQVEGGNMETGYSYGATGGLAAKTGTQSVTPTDPLVNPTAAPAGAAAPPNSSTGPRPEFGYTTRLNFGADVVSNTAAGPLVGHLEMQFENGNGFDNTGNGAYINLAYVTWAGITAGKAPSFFSFTGGGAGWANFFSPDQKGFNQPDVLAYTASTGGGFSATIALQSPGTDCPTGASLSYGCSGGGTNDGVFNGFYRSGDIPDIVGALALSQAWGSAQVSGVAHDVRANSTAAIGLVTTDKWGWGIDAGISFNLPSGAGDDILITGAWTQNATWYSGLNDGIWGEAGAINGNGQSMFLYDIGYNYDGSVQNPTAWSVSAEFDHHFNPQLSASIEGSVGGIQWSHQLNTPGFYSDLSNSTSWLIGFVGHYDPVTNLDFELEIFYQDTHTDAPNSANPALWHSDANGVAGRFEVTRSW